MRKWVTYLALAAAALGVGGVLAWRTASRQPKPWADAALASYRDDARYDGLTIRYPLDETLFPPEIAPPTFRWEDHGCDANGWLVVMEFQDDQGRMSFPVLSPEWTPSDDQWERIKRRSLDGWTKVTVLGVDREASNRVVSGSAITIKTSQDKVGAPLFFREVNLPFLEAVKDPSRYIRWRFGPVSSKVPPPIVLEKLPVCGNCHSFSADGKTLALEVDSGNDKGAYAIAPVERNIVLDPNKIITWSDYRREDNEVTFGLLCQASPDGRYVVGTVKDRALAVYRNELAFSQLFFLVKGILAIYDRQTRSFYTLPGADDRRHVQTNGTWSPDGKYIVFARSRDEAYDPPGLRHVRTVLVPRDSAKEFLSGGRKFRYDLYRIPFNGGQGGRAEPLEGASNNGMSNYFAKYSPDGKWIVFCKADSFMLLQPDSELYIIPAEGGEARRLRANTERMNSWHSWSPNGRWLVFSSKANTVYTQLFLTHIDEQGRSSPPVVLSHFTAPNRAANIPEFVNASPDAIQRIRGEFLDALSYCRAAQAFLTAEDEPGAAGRYEQALGLDPNCIEALEFLGVYCLNQGRLEEAKAHLEKLIELKPEHAVAHGNLGILLAQRREYQKAIEHCREALRIDPQYAVAHRTLGALLLEVGQREEGKKHLGEAVRINPADPVASSRLADALCKEAKHEQAIVLYRRSLSADADFIPALLGLASVLATSADDTLRDGEEAVGLATRACELTGYDDPAALNVLAAAYAEMGRFPEALSAAWHAERVARGAGDQALLQSIQQRIALYHRGLPFRQSNPAQLQEEDLPE